LTEADDERGGREERRMGLGLRQRKKVGQRARSRAREAAEAGERRVQRAWAKWMLVRDNEVTGNSL
jgi:hypothetical protein